VRDKTDTSKNADRKIKLIDGFGFSSSYNLLADSFALGSFNLYVRSTLFDKINITASASLDPYQVNKFGQRVNAFMLKKGKLGRITNGSLAISTNFQSKSKDGKNEEDSKNGIPNDPFLTPDEQQRQLDYIRQNPAEYTDFNIPWKVDLSYSLSFYQAIKPDYSGYNTETFSSLNFNGDFSLSPKWKVGATGYYDLKYMNFQQFSMFISREMHCWQLSVNITPVGLWRSFNIVISPKSGILRDLKINRNRTFSNL
ncbi:MAG TPA: putative LPS assembly protein LptD, partial [Chitinophagaceae bacterium]|nr:putative LPS assembly protein LptD [Chitinophagaceae bacterium]